MVVVSYSGKEINAKLVYYGPGLSGKTTNLEHIYQSVPASNRGKMVSMKTRTERTLFFDFLPVDLGEIGGFKTRFLLYTVPGQVYYNATRKLVLRGVDAVIFVADSGQGKMEENLESLENLRENLREYGLSLDEMPWVIQYNKRDLPNAYSLEELEAALNPAGVPSFEAVATSGQGVFECFRGTARILLQKLSQEIKLGTTKPSALTAPRAGEGDSVSMAAPPGLISGAAPGKGYRPPLPTSKPGAVPPAVPQPPRPAPPTPTPIEADKAAPGKPYRPPLPGQTPPPVTPRPGQSRVMPSPFADAPPKSGASRIMPSPVPPPPPLPEPDPAGASWFEEDVVAESVPDVEQVEEVFAPSLELDESETVSSRTLDADGSWMNEAGSTQSGYIETIKDDDFQTDEVQVSGDALTQEFQQPVSERTHTGLRASTDALSRGIEPDSDDLDFEEDEPGFWGRLFRRKTKDRDEAEQFRRYPAPDVTAKTKPLFDEPSLETMPPATPLEPMDAPSPRAKVPPPPPQLHREPRPVTPPASSPAPAWTQGPVVVERTIQVPIALGPEEVRRGAVLKVTLEIVVDGSQTRQERDRAA